MRYGDKKLKIQNGSREYFLLTERESIKRGIQYQDESNQNGLSASEEHLNFIKNIKENDFGKFEAFDLSLDRDKCLFRPIKELPLDIFKLSHLKRLHLDGNCIKSLPDQLGSNLINLEILTASNNKITKLPNSFSNLKNLISLHLSNNRFVEFPKVVCSIQSLVFLDLSSNKIEHLPNEIENLKNLESLLLNHNMIFELPKTIGNLFQLKTLWIGNNNIEKLPNEIIKLKNLEWNFQEFDHNLSTIFSNNPLVSPPIAVLELGIIEIKNYFSKINEK